MTEHLRVEYRKIETLILSPAIRARIPRRRLPLLASSIVEFGWTQPILVDGANGIIGPRSSGGSAQADLLEVPVIELGFTSRRRRSGPT